MRLIDADALKDKCYITVNGTTIGRNNYVMFHEIDDTPTIDAVEVVRCKDCKHKYVSGNGTTQYYVCDFMDAQYEENGFCHHAEREIKE